jgi:hypothetical protein
MAELCREFGFSRKTGYKIFGRYQQCGVQGLTDRSRRPIRYAHHLPFQVENYILNVKRKHNGSFEICKEKVPKSSARTGANTIDSQKINVSLNG